MRIKIYVPEKVQSMVRELELTDPDPEIGISKHMEDIYVVDKPVPAHIDNQKPWQNVALCVLVNDGNYFLEVGGNNYDLEIGSVIKFDGNIEHSLKNINKETGRFGALIWDIDLGENIGIVSDEMVKRVLELEREVK